MAEKKIGVLLPVRLETKFVAPDVDGDPWLVKVAVIPDEVAMNRHSPKASDGELVRLEAALRASAGDLFSETGRDAFRNLAGEVGAARASWLARTFPLKLDENGAIDWNAEHVIDWEAAQGHRRAPGESSLSTIDGLPDQVEIWIVIRQDGGLQLQRLEPALTIRKDQLGFDAKFRLFADGLWWTRDAGLANILELPFTEESQLHSIECMLAVGLGDDPPAVLLQAQRDAGALSILPLGQPTNTIAGAPAVDLARDPDAWWKIGKVSEEPDTAHWLAFALTGAWEALDPLPGKTGQHRDLNTHLVSALWSALWGHTLRDVWGTDRYMDRGFTCRLGLWAGRNLYPEGPLAPIRVGEQPYGVLPVSSLGLWTPGGVVDAADQMVPFFRSQRDEWARLAAEQTGTAAGAQTERLLDLLARLPNSSGYAYRRFAPLQALLAMASALGDLIDPNQLRNEWEQRTGAFAPNVLPMAPIRRYATYGWPQNNRLALVEPEPLTDEEMQVVEAGGSLFFDWLEFLFELGMRNPDQGMAMILFASEFRRPFPPNSLLLRLLIYSVAVAHADMIQLLLGREGPLIEPFLQNETVLWELLNRSFNGRKITFQEVIEPQGIVDPVVSSPQHELCLVWIETIRSLLHQYQLARDAGPPVVQALLAGIERAFRATLDTAALRVDPWITGMAWQRLLRLRGAGAADGLGIYGWVDRPYTGRPGPTSGGILHAPSEAQLRAAVVLRDKAASDPASTRWQLNLDSRQVRLAAQLAGEVRAGSPIQEVLGRAVEKIIGWPATVRTLRQMEEFWIRREHAGRRVVDGQKVLARTADFFINLGLDEGQQAEIEELKTVLDTYADLLVADAVYNVTNGRPEKAGETLEAAAGLELPPALEVLRTPHRGRSVSTRVLLALPAAQTPSYLTAGVSPAALADAAVAAFVAQRLPAGDWRWTTAAGMIDLDDLRMSPADTLSLSEDNVRRLVASVGGGEITLDESLSPGLVLHRRARRLVRLLSGECLQEQTGELRTRYERLHRAAGRLLAALAARRAIALVHARRWGIVPPEVGVGEAGLAAQIDSALATLSERITGLPAPGDFNERTPVHQITTALAELASPGSGFPIFGRSRRAALDGLLPQFAAPGAQRYAQLQANPVLDRTWLEPVAAARPNLARLESYQLEAAAGRFRAWTNQDDAWELQPHAVGDRIERTSRLVVVYGPTGVLNVSPNRNLALLQLDAWGETVPSEAHATSAAFGFNAPGSRAPQAVLIAVTPDETRPLDGETLAQIVLETRTLAHARMAAPADITAYAGAFPFSMLPVKDPTGVSFELSKR